MTEMSVIVSLVALVVALAGTGTAIYMASNRLRREANPMARLSLVVSLLALLVALAGSGTAIYLATRDDDPAKVSIVYSDEVSLGRWNQSSTAVVTCPAGMIVTGGGGRADAAALWMSQPIGPRGWMVAARTVFRPPAVGTVRAWAICAAP